MAERDFRLQPEEAVTDRDFTLNADEADTTAGQPIIKLNASLGLSEFEQMMGQTQEALLADGYDPADIDALTNPFKLGEELPEHLDLNDVYQKMVPILQENQAAIEETWKINEQIKADGVTMGPLEWSAMRRMVEIYGVENVAGMAEARTWWQRTKRSVGDRFAASMSDAVVDFSLGMALLDVFSYGNKKFKLQFVPKDQRAELEELVLPSITLENGKEYQLGTSAAWGIIQQRAFSGVEIFSGGITQAVGAIFGSNTLEQLGQASVERGAERGAGAKGQVPSMVSGLGERLSWQEVVERNWDPVADIDSMYAEFDDMGVYGDIAMGAIALGDGVAEITFDPLLILGGFASKAPGVGRALVGKFAPAKSAEILSDVARSTNRFEDAVDAVTAAQLHVKDVEAVAKAQSGATGGQISMESARKIVLARKQLAREKMWMSRFEDAGPNEPILRRSARRNPEMIPETRTELAYVDKWTAPRKGDASDSFKAVLESLTPTQLRNAPNVRSAVGRATLKEDQIDTVRNTLNEVAKRELTGESLTGVPSRAELTDRISKLQAGAIRDLDAALKFEDELAAIPELKSLLIKAKPAPGGVMIRSVDDVAADLRQTRKLELTREADAPIDWDKVDDLPIFSQRQLLGPDDAEQAGDALNLMVRTGGVGIDDVATTPLAPELKMVPDSQMSLIDWRAIDRANQATKAERQFMATSGARQFDLGSSSRRSLSRQLDIVRRNLGHARERGDKGAIKVFTEEMAGLKGTIKTMGKEGLLKKVKGFDDAWLPKSEPGIMQDPGRFNSWLNTAGDRVTRSLYPGGLGLNALGDTRIGQLMGPLREPQRFFDQYDPATWDRIRSSYLRYQRESRAFYERTLDGAERAGIVTKKAKFDPTKDFSPFRIDKKKNELLFDLLDEPQGTEKFKALAAGADDAILKFHDELRATLDHAADVQGLSDTPKYLTGYIRHVFDGSQFANGARPLEYIGLPGKADVFASHLLTRTGRGGYPRDALLALDLYGRAMNRKLIIEPMYDDIIRTGSELAAKHNNPVMQTYANDLVAQLKGTPRVFGARVDEWIGGAVNSKGKTLWKPGAIDRALVGLSGLFWTGALPGNPRYPLMQIATGVATTSSRFGMYRTSKALWQMGTREGQAINKQLGTYDNFLNILESDFGRKFSTFIAKRGYTVTPLGVMSTAQTEEFIRGATALAAADMHMTKLGISSWAEAKELGVINRIAFEALRSSEEVNHMFGALGRSPWATRTLSPNNGMAVSATQFLSFIPKQTEELVSQFNRDPGMIAQYLAMSGWISRLAAEEMGIDVTNYVGLGYGPETPDELTSPAVDTWLKGMEFLYQATPAGSTQGRSDSANQFMDALDGLIPMLVAFETAGKGSQRMLSQEQNTAKGERSRTLEMGNLGDALRSEDYGALFTEDLPRAIDPATSGDGVSVLPGVGGDLLPTVFGQQSIRENLFRRGQQAVRRENERFLFELGKTMRDFANAATDGDMETAQELEQKLMNDFGQVLASDTAMEKAIIAREVAWTIRQLDRAPDQVKARMVKIIREFGLPLEP